MLIVREREHGSRLVGEHVRSCWQAATSRRQSAAAIHHTLTGNPSLLIDDKGNAPGMRTGGVHVGDVPAAKHLPGATDAHLVEFRQALECPGPSSGQGDEAALASINGPLRRKPAVRPPGLGAVPRRCYSKKKDRLAGVSPKVQGSIDHATD